VPYNPKDISPDDLDDVILFSSIIKKASAIVASWGMDPSVNMAKDVF